VQSNRAGAAPTMASARMRPAIIDLVADNLTIPGAWVIVAHTTSPRCFNVPSATRVEANRSVRA